MPRSIPPLPGLTRYTRWDLVPDGLYTKTQLDRQGLKPGSDPMGQVLYNGNSYAPLYLAASAVPKRTCSPEQRAALDRARALQYVCRRCGLSGDEPLGRGRWCAACSVPAALFTAHDQAQQLARELVTDQRAVVLAVDAESGSLPGAQTVAVVGLRDRELLFAGPAGAPGTVQRTDLVARLDALLADRLVVKETDSMGPSSRSPYALVKEKGVPVAPGPHPLHPWASVHSHDASLGKIWAGWFGWTDHPSSTIPCLPWEWGGDVPLAWSRSLNLETDARSMTEVLHRIADGTEPVWKNAAWLLDGHGEPDLIWIRTRQAGAGA
ncbi:hypothetical protein ACFXAZ_34350 [Streptomyces sp. NPDC059477]|uniref:hypothetical protein n=1 Tax=Streptomyces sp. NPDC059477 TaxID=3346847 RepID=UPI00368118BC